MANYASVGDNSLRHMSRLSGVGDSQTPAAGSPTASNFCAVVGPMATI